LKGKKLIALLVSVGLLLALVLSGCAAPESEVVEKTVKETVTETETVEVEKTYQVVNPQGIRIPVECHPCAPRLDSLAGKTVLFYQSEANNVQMPVLLEQLKKDYPSTTFEVIYTEGFGERTPTEEQINTYQAVIRGIGW
jgi:hypothetical protein